MASTAVPRVCGQAVVIATWIEEHDLSYNSLSFSVGV